MFNLDSLNESRLKAMQCHGWEKGCIFKSLDSFIESLVQRVNRGRFKFKLGDSNNRPRLLNPQTKNNGSILSNQLDSPIGDTQLNSVGPNIRDLSPLKSLIY